MDQAKILEIAIRLLGEACSYPTARMQASTRLRDDLGLGSLELLELVLALEQELGITVQEGELSNVQTIGDVVEVARSFIAKQETA